MFTVQMLKDLIASGEFHHATYRDYGTIWEGLYIYKKQDNRFNGFTLAGRFDKDECDEAYAVVRSTGVYEGSYR